MDASLAALSCSLGSTTTWDCLTIHTGSGWFANKWKHGCQKTQESWAQSQQNFSLCHITQWNCNGSIAEEKRSLSPSELTLASNDKTANHVEQKCPVWILHKFAACQRHNTRCHWMPQKQISIWLYLRMMTDSYAWFQSSASSQINLVAGLQVFRNQRNQRSSTSAISDSDSSSSTPWDMLFWGPCFASLKQLRHLDSYELAQVAKQDPVAKVRTLKTVWAAILIYNSWMFVVYHQQIAPMYLKWAFKSQQKYLESQKQMI